MRDSRERLRDILEAIAAIERYAQRGRSAFDEDELIQNWCVRHLQIIGEAVRALPDDVRNRAPAVPWSHIIGVRHILVRDYFEIDAEVLWDAIANDLPQLRVNIEALLAALEGDVPLDAGHPPTETRPRT